MADCSPAGVCALLDNRTLAGVSYGYIIEVALMIALDSDLRSVGIWLSSIPAISCIEQEG